MGTLRHDVLAAVDPPWHSQSHCSFLATRIDLRQVEVHCPSRVVSKRLRSSVWCWMDSRIPANSSETGTLRAASYAKAMCKGGTHFRFSCRDTVEPSLQPNKNANSPWVSPARFRYICK